MEGGSDRSIEPAQAEEQGKTGSEAPLTRRDVLKASAEVALGTLGSTAALAAAAQNTGKQRPRGKKGQRVIGVLTDGEGRCNIAIQPLTVDHNPIGSGTASNIATITVTSNTDPGVNGCFCDITYSSNALGVIIGPGGTPLLTFVTLSQTMSGGMTIGQGTFAVQAVRSMTADVQITVANDNNTQYLLLHVQGGNTGTAPVIATETVAVTPKQIGNNGPDHVNLLIDGDLDTASTVAVTAWSDDPTIIDRHDFTITRFPHTEKIPIQNGNINTNKKLVLVVSFPFGETSRKLNVVHS